MNKSLFFVFIFIFSYLHSSIAQQDQFYGQGKLSSNSITTIIQDTSGFIWIGTENGLNKFDGWKFTHYFNNNKDTTSLSGNFIETFLMDAEGLLWIGSNKGLQYYYPKEDNFRTINFPEGISPSIKDMVQLHNGEILAVTAGYGIFSIDKPSLKATSLSDINIELNNPYAVQIFQDRAGQVWIGLSDNRIACLSSDRKKIQTFQLPVDSRQRIYGIIEDDSGCLFIATSAEVFLWDNIRKEVIQVKKEIAESLIIRGITRLNDGSLYVYTIGQGLKYLDPDAMLLRSPSHLPNGYKNPKNEKIRAFFEDKDGNLWLGYYNKGLSMKLTESTQFEFWSFPELKVEGAFYTTYCDLKNNLWVGMGNGKLLRLDTKGSIRGSWQLPVGISSIFEDSTGTFWMGSYSKGLGVFDKQTGKYKNLPLFDNEFIASIGEDKRGNLYVSVFAKGFAQYNPSTQKGRFLSDTVRMEDSSHLFNNWVGNFLCDSDGMVWLALSSGVDCFDPEKNIFPDFPGKSVLQSYNAGSLLEDKKKNIWIGTTNGLFRYNKKDKSLKYYGREEGLPNNSICSLGIDSEGNIWGSTQNGLFQLKVKDDRIACYYSGNGLVDREYSRHGVQNRGGYIYFAGLRGITRFKPDSIRPQQMDYQPVLTHLYINNSPISPDTKIDSNPIVETLLIDASEIRLSYREKNFSFEFSTMNFHHTENIIFEYRLIGVNEEWSKTFPGENRITYNSLAPGNYTLEIRAYENNTYSLTKSLSIVITPPWYVRPWAIFFYILFSSVLLFTCWYMWNKRQLKRREEQSNEEKLKFFINIAHEIRSPLTLILSPLSELLKQEHDTDTTKLLRTMQRNSNRIMSLINQLLDIRKIDKGQMKIVCEETNLVDFVGDLLHIFDYQATKNNINFSFETTVDYLPVWIDRNNFDKILMNLLVNSFKFTQNGGEIRVHLSAVQSEETNSTVSYAEIQIIDSGPGLNENETERIFERFYQASSQSSFGFGIGLNLTKMLVDLHHGSIRASNRSDTQGSCFTVRIPLGNDHLMSEEISNTPSKYTTQEPTLYRDEKENPVTTTKNKAQKKVLVVDDDEEIREYLQRELSRIYKVVICKDGSEALQILLTQRIDLIISDVMMPEMNGFTLLKKIKSNNNISHIPVILLTSQIEFETRMKGWNVGADGFMEKPFQIEELLLQCDNLIANRSLLKGKFVGIKELEGKMNPLEVKSNDELFMNRLMNLINQNLSNPQFTVEMLTKEASISRAHLHRKIKEITGITTSDFIRNVRLKQAAKLLVEKKINISQVAYATGFTSPTVFAVTFKKFYGCTPTEYMDKGEDKEIE